MTATGNASSTATGVEYDIAFPITYASSKVATASCTFDTITSSNYSVRFSVYDWDAAWDTSALDNTTKLNATANDGKRKATTQSTTVTDGGAPSSVTANTQSGGTNGNWSVTAASTATYTNSSKVMVCSPQVEYIATSIANAATAWTAGSAGLFSGNWEIFFGETETVSSSTTTENQRINATLAQAALSDAITQVTTGTVASGTATAATGLASAPTLKVTCWTSSTAVMIDIDLGMTSSVALASGNIYSAMVCYKLGASEFQCAAAKVTGASSATYGNVTWLAYGAATAPAASDFSSVTNQQPDHSSLLGATTKYYPLFKGNSIDTSSGVTAATKSSTTTNFNNNTDFYWSATGNTITSGTTFACRLQYKNTRADAAAATAVKTSLDGWVASTVGGAATTVSSTITAAYGATALTIATTTSTTTTTTTGATTIGLSLATLAAALATVVAF